MANLDDISNKTKQLFKKLDANEDGNLSEIEFSKLKMPNLSEDQRKVAFKEMANQIDKPQLLSAEEVDKTILTLQGRDKEDRFREVADRLEKVFGKEVTIPKLRDFNGVPSFHINAATNKDDAERIIDNLIKVRERMGLDLKDIGFASNNSGDIIIYGGNVLNYKGTGAFAVEKVFNALENPENIKSIQECLPKKEEVISTFDLREVSERLAKIFNVDVNYATVRGESTILIETEETNIVKIVDKLVELRSKLGISRDNLTFFDDIQGQVGIDAQPFISNNKNDVEKILKILEKNQEQFRDCMAIEQPPTPG